MTFSPAADLVAGAMFVSEYEFEIFKNWEIPTLLPRRKHKKKQMTTLVYAGAIRLEAKLQDGRCVSHIKHTFIMGGGRYIIDALEYLKLA